MTGEVFDYLVSHGRMKEKEARAKFRQVRHIINEFFQVKNLFTFDKIKIWEVQNQAVFSGFDVLKML